MSAAGFFWSTAPRPPDVPDVVARRIDAPAASVARAAAAVLRLDEPLAHDPSWPGGCWRATAVLGTTATEVVVTPWAPGSSELALQPHAPRRGRVLARWFALAHGTADDVVLAAGPTSTEELPWLRSSTTSLSTRRPTSRGSDCATSPRWTSSYRAS